MRISKRIIREYKKCHKMVTIRYVLNNNEFLKECSYHLEWRYKGKKYSNNVTTKIVNS
jgi:hypothetical protein